MDNERDDYLTCTGCGTEVAPAVDRVYPIGPDDVLCMRCSLARGGAYDEVEDRWVVAPHIDDLVAAISHPLES